MTERLKPLHHHSVAIAPMDGGTQDIFLRMTLADKGAPKVAVSELAEQMPPGFAELFQAQVVLQRLAIAAEHSPELRFTVPAVMFGIAMAHHVGAAVIWAYELVELARGGPCDMWAITRAFPNGFPARDAMQAYWDDQKSPDAGFGGNRLDMAETWHAQAEATDA